MAANSNHLKELVTEYISTVADLDETRKSKDRCGLLQEHFYDFTESEASISECNTLVYEMVKERLKSDGKINDSMSETQIDWMILTDSVVTNSINLTQFIYQSTYLFDPKWKDVVYVKLLEFPRFNGFMVRANKRCLLTWMELFTALLDIETKKSEGGKKKSSFESSKVIQQCQSILETCDKWNDKVALKHPEFQLDLAHRIKAQLFEGDSSTSSATYKTPNLEKVWTDRLTHLCLHLMVHHESPTPDQGLDLSNDAMTLMMLLKRKTPIGFVRSHCSIPLTEDEEKYLLERRLKYEENRYSKCKANPSNTTKTLSKVKRGTKARAARKAAAKEKRRDRERKRKRKLWYVMQDTLFNIFEAPPAELEVTTFTDLANQVFKSKLKRQTPTAGPISFKDWQNIDLLIQLIKVEAIPDWTKEAKLTFQWDKTLPCYTSTANKAPANKTIEMSKKEALEALRKLRHKLRRDPDYFKNL